MARKSRQGVLKRQRERKKAEKAAFKREQRTEKVEKPEGEGSGVASEDDLAGYGLLPEPEPESEEETESGGNG